LLKTGYIAEEHIKTKLVVLLKPEAIFISLFLMFLLVRVEGGNLGQGCFAALNVIQKILKKLFRKFPSFPTNYKKNIAYWDFNFIIEVQICIFATRK
jgi:hypothetical protein